MSRQASEFQEKFMSRIYSRHILITHQDTDHVGAVETDSDGLFRGRGGFVPW